MPWLGLGAAGGAGAGGAAAGGAAAGAGAGAVGASGLGIGGATAAGGLGTAGGLGLGGAAATPGLSVAAGGGSSLGGLFGTGANVAGALKGAADYIGQGVKKAISKTPTHAKTVTGNPMVDGFGFGAFGHVTDDALAAAKTLSPKSGASGMVPGGSSFPVLDVMSPNANANLAKGLSGASDILGRGYDAAKNAGSDYLLGPVGPDGSRGPSGLGGNASDQIMQALFRSDQAPPPPPMNGAPRQQQQQRQSPEDQMNALLMGLFQGRQQA